jgi:cyclase
MTMRLLKKALFAAVATAIATVANAQAVQDFSKVEIKATQVAKDFYTLEGQGGTIGVLVGPDGVFMVDTQFAPLSDKIAAAIARITPRKVRWVVNTHVHGDHTGGNENFGRMGAQIIAREELRSRLMHPLPGQNGQPVAPTAAIGLPTVTYGNRMLLHVGEQEVQLVAVPRAHTDGDTMVWFPGLDAVMTGDFYRAVGFPNVDLRNGGSLQGLIDGLGQVIGRAGPNTKIIPGHGPMVDRAAVIAHRDMVLAVRARVATLIAQGRSEDEVVAARPTADQDVRVTQPDTSAERFVRQVYAELAPAH